MSRYTYGTVCIYGELETGLVISVSGIEPSGGFEVSVYSIVLFVFHFLGCFQNARALCITVCMSEKLKIAI